MPFLESYIEIEEEISSNDNQIKTYKAKREFIIKEIFYWIISKRNISYSLKCIYI